MSRSGFLQMSKKLPENLEESILFPLEDENEKKARHNNNCILSYSGAIGLSDSTDNEQFQTSWTSWQTTSSVNAPALPQLTLKDSNNGK